MKVSKNTAAGKGIRTGVQSVVGSVVSLALAIWAVPGVPEVVTSFIAQNWLPLLLTVGVSSGIGAWLQNKLEERARG